jgi:hypothetical protein
VKWTKEKKLQKLSLKVSVSLQDENLRNVEQRELAQRFPWKSRNLSCRNGSFKGEDRRGSQFVGCYDSDNAFSWRR